MKGNHSFTRQEIQLKLDSVIGLTLGEADVNNVFSKTKNKPKITGIAGDVVEQSILGYTADHEQKPDLDIDGVPTELKTTGVRIKNGIYVAKEPASVTAVSINSIVSEEFYTSALWHKISHMLFVFYHYEPAKTVTSSRYSDFVIMGWCFHEFSDDDVKTISNDWQIIHDFIAEIQRDNSPEEAFWLYPDLSTKINRRTAYLDTAPKYPNRPRFRLRARVITFIIQQHFSPKSFEKLPDKYTGQDDLVKKCVEITNKFRGLSMEKILQYFGLHHERNKSNPKHMAEQVIVRMFGGASKKISKIDIFAKFGIVGKSITVTDKGTRTEDCKLLPVDFSELASTWTSSDDPYDDSHEMTFEDSELFRYITDNKILFIQFYESPSRDVERKVDLKDNIFMGFKLLDLSGDDIVAEARKTWNEAHELIINGNFESSPVYDKAGNPRYTPRTHIPMTRTNLPKSKDHLFFFRGTGADAKDKRTFLGSDIYRQDYWIKGTFLAEKLASTPLLGDFSPLRSASDDVIVI